MTRRAIWCCGCNAEVQARLTTGDEVYRARSDLASLRLWRCDGCGNYVGTHKRSPQAAPLGCIPTPELREARKHIHAILDPLWKGGRMSRGEVYGALSQRLGREYHTAEIRSVEEARLVYRLVQEIARA